MPSSKTSPSDPPGPNRLSSARRIARATILVTLMAASASCASPASDFEENAAAAGLDFVLESGASGGMYLPEIVGGGVAVFDADGDGDMDIYFNNGNEGIPEVTRDGPSINRYFENRGAGRFVDATEASGLGDPGFGMGLAVGDIDNDGDEDLYLSNLGPDQLYRNLGGGRFEDITAAAGIVENGFSSSAAFLDYDRDGLLDIFVARYVAFNPSRSCTGIDGRPDYCGPAAYDAVHDVLLRNLGDGRFEDVSQAAGLTSAFGAGFGVVISDFDEDGWIDVYVANDGDPNQMWINQRDGSFRDRAVALGVAVDMHGREEAGMGVIAADFDADGFDDLFLTHLREETNTLYRNLGQGMGFSEDSGRSGLGEASLEFTGFGTATLDLELDGDLDILVVNGRVKGYEPLAGARLPSPWDRLAEPNHVYLNDGSGAFAQLPVEDCGFCQERAISRGLAVGDLDEDGDLDAVVTNVESPARLYWNRVERQGRYLKVRVEDPELNRLAIGARLWLEVGQRVLARTVSPAQSYLSSNDPRLHFGLGPADAVDRARVRWPDGSQEAFEVACVDCEITLRRGEGRVLDGP